MAKESDRLNDEGLPIESSLDHIYRSTSTEEITEGFKTKYGSTDHVPIIMKIRYKNSSTKLGRKQVTRRCMKNFNIQNWNDTLNSSDSSRSSKKMKSQIKKWTILHICIFRNWSSVPFLFFSLAVWLDALLLLMMM